MPDLEQRPSPVAPEVSRSAAPGGAADDPLSHLHKMSTTAGLGSTDYVAINAVSVFALIFGLASALALVDRILLILPVVAVICAVLALWQIGHSGGTQAGRALAVLGILLALGFGGYVVFQQATEARRTRADREAIQATISKLAEHVKAGQFQEAYGLFSDRFTSRWPYESFVTRVKPLQGNDLYGKLTEITTNGLFNFQTDPETGRREAATVMIMKFEKVPQAGNDETMLSKEGGNWRIVGMSGLFPPEQAPPPQQPPQQSPAANAPQGSSPPPPPQ